MLIYLGIDVFIIMTGYVLVGKKVTVRGWKVSGTILFFMACGFLLIFFSAFRGDFSADYTGYEDIFLRFKNNSFQDILHRPIFSNPETGYLLFQHVIRNVFGDVIYLFIAISLIVVLCNLLELRKNGALFVLAVFLFVEAGIYYSSFNLIRQAFACSLAVAGSKFLYERAMWKYFVVIILACTIHTSVILMIPFYFASVIKIRKRSFLLYPIVMTGLLFLQPYLMDFVNQYLWTWYDVKISVGYSWKNIVAALFLAGTALCIYFFEEKQETGDYNLKERIWLNATILYLIFYLMGLTYSYAQRFSMLFSMYTICFFCLQVSKSKYRRLLEWGVMILLVLHGLFGKMEIPYYFIWDR